jgi:hypothetical protein
MKIIEKGFILTDEAIKLMSSFNPPKRTDDVSDIVALMAKYGYFEDRPISLGTDGMADGHRRTTAAKQAGISHIPYLKYDEKAAVVYAILNTTAKPVQARDFTYAIGNGMGMDIAAEYSSKNFKRALKHIEASAGPDSIYKVAHSGISLTTMEEALGKLHRAYGEKFTHEFAEKAVTWMLLYRMTSLIRAYIAQNFDLDELYSAILENRPVTIKPKTT